MIASIEHVLRVLTFIVWLQLVSLTSAVVLVVLALHRIARAIERRDS